MLSALPALRAPWGLVLLLLLLEAAAPAAAGPPQLAVTLHGLAAASAARFAWSASTATYPSGLNIRLGSYVGSLVVSTNFTRSPAGSAVVVGGVVRVANGGARDALLSGVQALLQPGGGLLPQRALADCPRNSEGLIELDAGASLACPFAAELPPAAGAGAASLGVVGQAQLLDGALASSSPGAAWFASPVPSSSPGGGGSGGSSLALARCAVLTDTFHSGELFLTPSGVAAGAKLPALGSGTSVCSDSVRSVYRVTFGPFSAGQQRCGAFKVMNLARANPLGGSQPAALASSVVLVSITGCDEAGSSSGGSSDGSSTAPAQLPESPVPGPAGLPPPQEGQPVLEAAPAAAAAAAAVPPLPPAAAAEAAAQAAPGDAASSPSPSSGLRLAASQPPADSVIFGPPAAPAPAAVALPAPVQQLPLPVYASQQQPVVQAWPGVASWAPGRAYAAAQPAAGYYPQPQPWAPPPAQAAQPQQQPWAPAPYAPAPGADVVAAPLPAPAPAPQQQGDEYFYTYEYEAPVPQPGSTRRLAAAAQEPAAGAARPSGSGGGWHAVRQLRALDSLEEQRLQQQQQRQQQRQQQLPALDWQAGAWLSSMSDPLQHGYGLGAAFEQAQPGGWGAVPGLQHAGSPGLAAPLQGQQVQAQPPGRPYNGLQQGPEQWQHLGVDADPSWQRLLASRQEHWRQRRRRLQQRQRRLRPSLLEAGSISHQRRPLPPTLAARLGAAGGDSDGEEAARQEAASQAVVTCGSLGVEEGVARFRWQPRALVSPPALRVSQADAAAPLTYNIKLLRTELPPVTLLRGQLLIGNPSGSVLRLAQVAVEVPAAGRAAWAFAHVHCPSPAAVAAAGRAPEQQEADAGDDGGAAGDGGGGSLVGLVPPRSQLSCSFELSYPAEAPAKATLVGRVVTEAGQELASRPRSFSRSQQPPQQQGSPQEPGEARRAPRQLGACALVSDSFLGPQDGPGLLLPSALPALGTKAPAAVGAAGGGNAANTSSASGGVLLCESDAFAYTATLGRFEPGQCGRYWVVSMLRVQPIGSGPHTPAPVALSTAVSVDIGGCQGLALPPSAPLLSAASITSDAAAYNNAGGSGAKLSLPLLELPPARLANASSYAWAVQAAPVAHHQRLHYEQSLWATFVVQFSRRPGPGGQRLVGELRLRNPNLLDALALVKLSVGLLQPGASGSELQASAACPRDASGAVVVPGQLVGSGELECSWQLELPRGSPAAAALEELGASALRLLATAVTATGREAASSLLSLDGSLASDGAAPAAPPQVQALAPQGDGACAALADAFLPRDPEGQALLVPGAPEQQRLLQSQMQVQRLPGDGGGGEAGDVVCDAATLSYGASLGPLGERDCGEHKATNLALASPTTGSGALAAAVGSMDVTVVGCPGRVAALRLSNLGLSLLSPVAWNVSGQVAGQPALGPLRLPAGASRQVALALRFSAQPQPQVRQLSGAVVLRSVGRSALVVQQLLVEVTPLAREALGQPPIAWPARCPIGATGGDEARGSADADAATGTVVASGASLRCSFAGSLPPGLVGEGLVVARLLLADGSQAASPAQRFDFDQPPRSSASPGRCAVVSDGFVGGRGRVVPRHSSRPASAAAPSRICNSQSVSFVVELGPLGEEACGRKLWMVNLARVNPIHKPRDDSQAPSSAVTALQVLVDCKPAALPPRGEAR